MAELADALDLGSSGEIRRGSTPLSRTTLISMAYEFSGACVNSPKSRTVPEIVHVAATRCTFQLLPHIGSIATNAMIRLRGGVSRKAKKRQKKERHTDLHFYLEVLDPSFWRV